MQPPRAEQQQEQQRRDVPVQDTVTYIPQTVVIGAFVVLLLARLTDQFAQIMQLRRRRVRRGEGLQNRHI